MKFYSSRADVEHDQSLIGYMRVLQRAWDKEKDGGFGLSSVLCVGGVPTLYQKISDKILLPADLNLLHRRFWNQGVASVFLIIDPRTVYILSGFQPPTREIELFDDQTLALVAKCDRKEFTREKEQALYETVENGEFYRRYTEKFRAADSVDHHLTQNLLGLRDYLLGNIGEEQAHDFICRLLFVCYIIDRKIYPLPDTTRRRLHEVLTDLGDDDAVDYLYRLFKVLKGKFNGSMFAQDLEAEKSAVTSSHMKVIKEFLNGDEIHKKQKTLGFWAYDFELIPIETISGIYENFLGREEQRGKGAYYTPRFLAEMTIDVACEGKKDWAKLRYFDPSCGSGVFLVTLFNRIATKWELDNRHLRRKSDYYEIKSKALREILEKQLCGMDVKLTACTLACFSLYVALLDSFDPSDIKTYLDKNELAKLPLLLLRRNGKRPENNFIPVVCEGDTLGANRFEGEKFDVVIGNPPWGKQEAKQLALRFVDRIDLFMDKEDRACLLLPSTIFLNITSDSWQADFLAKQTIERVVQLADFRFILFPTAKCPCMIVRFKKGAQINPRHEIIYDTPKFDMAFGGKVAC